MIIFFLTYNGPKRKVEFRTIQPLWAIKSSNRYVNVTKLLLPHDRILKCQKSYCMIKKRCLQEFCVRSLAQLIVLTRKKKILQKMDELSLKVNFLNLKTWKWHRYCDFFELQMIITANSYDIVHEYSTWVSKKWLFTKSQRHFSFASYEVCAYIKSNILRFLLNFLQKRTTHSCWKRIQG